MSATRAVCALPGMTGAPPRGDIPGIRLVPPKTLLVEEDYQRNLSDRSYRLIRRIVGAWSWNKFKPPICAPSGKELVVIDGQHTAIAAATLGLPQIPVLVTQGESLEARAAAFVSHNRDRLSMTPAEIFHGDFAAGDKTAKKIMAALKAAGLSVPRVPKGKGNWCSGEISAIHELRTCYANLQDEDFRRLLNICAASKIAPVGKMLMQSIRYLLTFDDYDNAAAASDKAIAGVIEDFPDFDACATVAGFESGESASLAAATLIANALKKARR